MIKRPQVWTQTAILSGSSISFGASLMTYSSVSTSALFDPLSRLHLLSTAAVLCIVAGVTLWTIFFEGPRLWVIGWIGSLVGSVVWVFVAISFLVEASTRHPSPAALPLAIVVAAMALSWLSVVVATWHEHHG